MDHDKTLELLAKGLEIAPGDWETRSHMADLCIELGYLDRAAGLLTEAPELPADVPGRLAAAELLARADAGSPALKIVDTLLAENKANARAHLLKARIYRDRGMMPEARKHYNVAAVIDESLEDAEFEAWLDGRPAPQTAEDLFPFERPREVVDLSHITSPLDMLDLDGQGGDGGEDEGEDAGYGPFTGPGGIELDPFDEEPYGLIPVTPPSKPLPTIRFADVGGMEELKERVRMKIIYPFKNQGVFQKFGKRAGGGLLLYGPPGCGKTLLARATAGECGAHFDAISVPDILSKWFGESESRLHALFETARRNAPSILFIDELDALGVKRTDTSGPMSSLVNVLLTEIDGAASNNEDVLVLGATNSPWRIDPAFRRPGRFDKTVFVPPPDADARAAIFGLLLGEVPCEDIDIGPLVDATDRFSGADLRAAVDAALELAIGEEMRTGSDTSLSGKMLTAAVKATRPTTLEWLTEATRYASFQNASGVYDELAEYLREGK